MEIFFPHILTDVTSKDVKKFGIQVSKATHGSFSQNQHLFKPQDITFKSDNYAVIRVTHCCFYCLEANSQKQMTPEVAQQMAKKVGYSYHALHRVFAITLWRFISNKNYTLSCVVLVNEVHKGEFLAHNNIIWLTLS